MRQSLLIGQWVGHFQAFASLSKAITAFTDRASFPSLSEVSFRSPSGVTAWFLLLGERVERARPNCTIPLPTTFRDYRDNHFDEHYVTRITLEGTRVLRGLVRGVQG